MSAVLAVVAQGADQLDPVPTPDIDLGAFLPLIALVGGAVLLLTAASLLKGRPTRGFYAAFTVVTAVVAGVAALPLWQRVTDSTDGPFTTVNAGFVVALTGYPQCTPEKHTAESKDKKHAQNQCKDNTAKGYLLHGMICCYIFHDDHVSDIVAG